MPEYRDEGVDLHPAVGEGRPGSGACAISVAAEVAVVVGEPGEEGFGAENDAVEEEKWWWWWW